MGKKHDKLRQRIKELQRQMSAQYTVTREHAERLRVLERMAGEAGACEPTVQFDQSYARGYNSPIINSTFVSRCSKHGDYTHHLVGQQCPQCVAASAALELDDACVHCGDLHIDGQLYDHFHYSRRQQREANTYAAKFLNANTATGGQGDGTQLDELNKVTFEVIRSTRDADN
jgi:hypothetical protein